MRKIGMAVAAAVGALGLAVINPGTALAALPAPHCESGASHYFCDGTGSGTTTWTVTYSFPGAPNTVTYTTPGPTLSTSCPYPRRSVLVSYSNSAGTSAIRSFLCNPGDWP
jgi:hypothetical protein